MASFLQTEITDPSYYKLETPAWLEHGPFAMWLVKKMRPRRIVELGTHWGYSYFAMCEAVVQAGLDTQCFAVDTWVGEVHAGQYGEDVFDGVEAENRKYAHFSTLLRKTFAEALADIEDGSIDLLHVDGRHFYDDVKEDYESWIPKLSDRAVVLFHDTVVRERGFGVYRYWMELAEQHPSFNFVHGHGLGVLMRGNTVPAELTELVSLSEVHGGPGVVEDFFQLAGGTAGERFRAHDRRVALEAERDNFQTSVAALSAQLQDLARELDRTNVERDNMQDELDNAKSAVAALSTQAQDLGEQRDQAVSSLGRANADLARARRRPGKTLWEFIRFKVLRGLSKASPPLPGRVTRRFARSAKKRDPNRSLIDPAATSAIGADAVTLPVSDVTNHARRYSGRVQRDNDLPDILIVSHDASRTGAPILALNLVQALSRRYNVTTLCLHGGALLDNFRSHSVAVWEAEKPTDGGSFHEHVLDDIIPDTDFAFAVVNSIESRYMLAPLKDRGIPSVILLHEFAANTYPKTSFRDAISAAGHTVFSTRLTLDNAVETNHLTGAPSMHVLPQGKCVVPGGKQDAAQAQAERDRLHALLRPQGMTDHRFIVIGAGYVDYRKGVDLFIDTAMHVLNCPDGQNALFVWVGAGFDPVHEIYSINLNDQLKRSGLTGRVLFLSETPEIETIYTLADALVVTSRLDPLPNVAIDAMCSGLPVLCFERTTGIAETLTEAGLAAQCVAPYLDTHDLADKLVALASCATLHADIREKTRAHGAKVFDFDTYARRIEALALSDSSPFEADADTILSSGHFAPDFCFGKAAREVKPDVAARRYLESARTGVGARKPEPGFHPFVFAQQVADALPTAADPYAEFLRRGRPEGPWMAQVIQGGPAAAGSGSALLRAALHVHAYYTDQVQDVVRRLDCNVTRPDLFISVADAAGERAVRQHLSNYSGKIAKVLIVPNAGRDIGPLLTAFGPDMARDYDVIGHVHTKKSAHVENARVIASWVTFMYSGVLGGKKAGPMMDRILQAMQDNDSIGIAYPDDPHILGWTENTLPASELARRMDIGPLPDVFNFPVGTMFWMRSAAFKPFIDLGLTWSDYPNEPTPIDGTVLHALERLFGVVPQLQGWRTAVTYTPGISR